MLKSFTCWDWRVVPTWPQYTAKNQSCIPHDDNEISFCITSSIMPKKYKKKANDIYIYIYTYNTDTYLINIFNWYSDYNIFPLIERSRLLVSKAYRQGHNLKWVTYNTYHIPHFLNIVGPYLIFLQWYIPFVEIKYISEYIII